MQVTRPLTYNLFCIGLMNLFDFVKAYCDCTCTCLGITIGYFYTCIREPWYLKCIIVNVHLLITWFIKMWWYCTSVLPPLPFPLNYYGVVMGYGRYVQGPWDLKIISISIYRNRLFQDSDLVVPRLLLPNWEMVKIKKNQSNCAYGTIYTTILWFLVA